MTVRTLQALTFLLTLTGCAVSIPEPKQSPRAELPKPQMTISTFALTNDPKGPEARLLRAAAQSCGLAAKDIDGLAHGGVYGIHGAWYLDYACPQ